MRRTPALNSTDHIPVQYPNWIWFPYIPANGATMIFGPGGIGKSYLTTEMAARLSNGEPMPGQSTRQTTKPHKVLMMTAEDDLSSIVVPRLMNQGANLSNIFVPSEPFVLDEWGIKVMKKYMEESGATIVIIDPIAHWMGGKIDINKMNEVRALTGSLHQHGIQTDCAVMLIHHSRKGKGDESDDIDKAVGSVDFINAVRSVMSIQQASDGTPVMRHLKTNYEVLGKALAYYIDGDGFHWIGEYDEDMLLQPTKKKKQEQARAFLEDMLRDGPVLAKEVVSAANDEGIPKATLDRAKPAVAESIMRHEDGTKCWYWRLKDDDRESREAEE